MRQTILLCILLVTCSAALAGTSVTSAAGEVITWWVIGDGSSSGISTNYGLDGTVGQTACDAATSTNYSVSQGFWQTFGSGPCCVGTRGNANMAGIVDLSDLALLISYLTDPPASKPTLACMDEANVNGTGIVDISDLALLVAYMTNPPASKPSLPACP